MSSEISPDWDELLRAASAGEEGAMAQLLERAEDALRREAQADRRGGGLPPMLRSKFSDSDVVQESLLGLANDLASFRGSTEQEFQHWARQIMRHNMVDMQRKFLNTEQRDVRREVAVDSKAEFPDRTKSPSSVFRRAEHDRKMEIAIADLPDRYRTAIQLRHQRKMSWDEIGQTLGVSAEAARKLWTRAVKQLRDKLSSEESRLG